MLKPSKRSVKELPEVLGVPGNAVGQFPLKVCPDKLIWVEFRRISGEVKGVDARMTSKESLDDSCLVYGASVPEKDNGAFEAAAKALEELADLFGPNVPSVKACVESKPFSLGGDCDGGDSRKLSPSPGDNQGWSPSPDRPSPLDVGNKRESALIQEDQTGPELDSLFLYAAKRAVSNNESLPLCAAWPSSAASDNSSPERPSDSIDCQYSNAPGNASERSGRYASKSKGRSSNRLPKALSLRRAPRLAFGCPIETKVGPYWVLASVHHGLSSGRFGANAPRSLKKNSVPGLPSDRYDPVLRVELPSGGAFLMSGVCHGVS